MYQYGNVAVKYQNEKKEKRYSIKPIQVKQPQKIVQAQPKPQKMVEAQPKKQAIKSPKVKKKSVRVTHTDALFSRKEKMLYICTVIVAVAMLSLLLARGAMLAEMNYEIQVLEKESAETVAKNAQLELEVIALSSPDRIIDIAKNDLGMKMHEATLRVVTPQTSTHQGIPLSFAPSTTTTLEPRSSLQEGLTP